MHFRDFMALQLTPMMGTTAYPDRMGDYHPEFLGNGRIIQGHNLSGAMPQEIVTSVNSDLADPIWRNLFQHSLLHDLRFQRGLFPHPEKGTPTATEAPPTPEWLQFNDMTWAMRLFDVKAMQTLSRQRLQGEGATTFEYGWALIKTAASLIYTIQLCQELQVEAATDSLAHHHLLARTCERDGLTLSNFCLKREGY